MKLLEEGAPFDAHAYLEKGWFEARMASFAADMALRAVSRLSYASIGSDMGRTAAREIAAIEPQSASHAPVMGIFRALIDGPFEPLARFYGVRTDPCRLTALRLGAGYSLDWHNHLRSGGAASILVYLFDGERETGGEGGELEFGAVQPDLASVAPIHVVKPVHGSVVLLGDGSHPLIKHRARLWSGRGSRYIVSMAYNAMDW